MWRLCIRHAAKKMHKTSSLERSIVKWKYTLRNGYSSLAFAIYPASFLQSIILFLAGLYSSWPKQWSVASPLGCPN